MTPVGFEPTISAGERQQTHALDRTATGIGRQYYTKGKSEENCLTFAVCIIKYYKKTGNIYTRVGTLIVATIYLQVIQNRYMFRSFTVLHCSHQHCVEHVASDVEVVGYF